MSILKTIDCKNSTPAALYKINDNLLLVGYENKLEVIDITNNNVINIIQLDNNSGWVLSIKAINNNIVIVKTCN